MKFFIPMSIIKVMYDVSNEIQKHEFFSVVLCQAFSPLVEEVFILREASFNIHRSHWHPNSIQCYLGKKWKSSHHLWPKRKAALMHLVKHPAEIACRWAIHPSILEKAPTMSWFRPRNRQCHVKNTEADEDRILWLPDKCDMLGVCQDDHWACQKIF